MAPIIPHFTEELYHLYFAQKENKKSIHISEWPKSVKKLIDDETEKAGDLAVEIIGAVRKFKAEKAVSLKEELKELIINHKDSKSLEPFLEDLKATTRAKEIKFEGKTDIEVAPELRIGILI
jgi:valyl-tRNA synthetase